MRSLNTLKTAVTLLTATCSPWFCLADTVGIVQVTEHPALDATRQGIIDFLKENLPQFTLNWESAQGNAALAIQATQKYLGTKANVIIAIGTTPAQAAVKLCQNSNIPVIYASVTDPKAAKLYGNVAGISNYVDSGAQLKMIRDILPNAESIGIIYNPGEANSEALIATMQASAATLNFKLILVTAEKTANVVMAAKQLCDKVDCLFINNDNTALAAFKSIVQVADKACIPVFASDTDLIELGAVAVLGPDQYQLGRQAGEMVVAVVTHQKKMSDFDIGYPRQVELHLNSGKATQLGLKLPAALCAQAKKIK